MITQIIILCTVLLFVFAVFIVAIIKDFQQKIKDEPIPGLHCKFCKKKQEQAKESDFCQHIWEEDTTV